MSDKDYINSMYLSCGGSVYIIVANPSNTGLMACFSDGQTLFLTQVDAFIGRDKYIGKISSIYSAIETALKEKGSD